LIQSTTVTTSNSIKHNMDLAEDGCLRNCSDLILKIKLHQILISTFVMVH